MIAGQSAGVLLLTNDSGFIPIGGLVASTQVEFNLEATEANVQVLAREAYTWSHIACRVLVNGTTAANSIFARLNGSDVTALEVLVPAGLTGWFEDTTGSQAVADGDLINFRVPSINGMHAQTFELAQVASRLDQAASEPRRPIIVAASPRTAWITTQGTTEFGSIVGWLTIGTTTEADLGYIVRQNMTLTNMRIMVSGHEADVASTFDLRVDGVSSTNLTISVPANTTGAFEDTDSEVISSGARLNYRKVAGSTGMAGDGFDVTLAHMRVAGEVLGRNLGLADVAPEQVQVGGTEFQALEDESSGFNVEEAEAQTEVASLVDVVNLFIRVIENALTTASTTYGVRVNGSTSALQLSVAAGLTGTFENQADRVSFVVDDLVAYIMTVSAGGIGQIAASMQCLEQVQPPEEGPEVIHFRSLLAFGRP